MATVDGNAPRATEGIRVTHLLFFLQLVVFLALVIGSKAAWVETALGLLTVGDATHTLTAPWSLITYPFISTHPLEFVVAAGVLLLAGVPVEERLGRARFLLLYFLSALFVALAHIVLVEAKVVSGSVFLGAIGASAGVLTAYLFIHGDQRQVGNIPFPVFYLITASFLFMVLALVDYQNKSDLQREVGELRKHAYDEKGATLEERGRHLDRVAVLEARRPNQLTHMLGLVLGGIALLLTQVLVRVQERYRVMREIRGLQEEVDARARVEVLLVKISREGMTSLTRNERKFLRYASRFYGPRVTNLH